MAARLCVKLASWLHVLKATWMSFLFDAGGGDEPSLCPRVGLWHSDKPGGLKEVLVSLWDSVPICLVVEGTQMVFPGPVHSKPAAAEAGACYLPLNPPASSWAPPSSFLHPESRESLLVQKLTK